MDSAAGGLAAVGGVFMIFVVVFSMILAILWILVPFAIFGIKPLLRDLIAEQRKTHAALATISQQLHTATPMVTSPIAASSPAPELAPPGPSRNERIEPTLGEIIREARKPD